MNKLDDIKNFIQNKRELCIFIDYKDLINEIFIEKDMNDRFIRIFENFTKQNFLKIYILFEKDYDKAKINKLLQKVNNLSIVEYNSKEFKKICYEFNKIYLPIYIGNNLEITNKIKKINNESIAIGISFLNGEKVNKNADIEIFYKNFERNIIEINNLYL